MRRIVVAHDEAGEATFASNEEMSFERFIGVGHLARLWSADGPATYPDAGVNPAAPGDFPPAGRLRFTIVEFAPNERVVGFEGDEVQFSEDGMHRTDSTDFDIVLEGEVVLSIPGGKEVTLRQGDVVVLAGADHAWRNDRDKPARVAYLLIGAHRREDS